MAKGRSLSRFQETFPDDACCAARRPGCNRIAPLSKPRSLPRSARQADAATTYRRTWDNGISLLPFPPLLCGLIGPKLGQRVQCTVAYCGLSNWRMAGSQKPRTLHPWPEQRFTVKHPRGEPHAGNAASTDLGERKPSMVFPAAISDAPCVNRANRHRRQ